MTRHAGETAGRRARVGTAGAPGFVPVLTIVLIGWAVAGRGLIAHPLPLPDRDAPRVGAAAWPDMRLDVNAASAAELIALPGVGPRLADRIVLNRTEAGPFRSLDDLARVHRVGPKLVERARPFAVAASSTTGVSTGDS